MPSEPKAKRKGGFLNFMGMLGALAAFLFGAVGLFIWAANGQTDQSVFNVAVLAMLTGIILSRD